MNAPTSTHAAFRRDVEQELLRGLPLDRRARLHDHLRACETCRAHHDRLHDGLRVLEGDPLVSDAELAQVERWVQAELPGGRTLRDRLAVFRPGRRGLAAVFATAAACAAAAVVLLRGAPESPPPPGTMPAHVMGLTAKGGGAAPALAVDVLCGPRPDALRPARPGGCALSETLAFAYRAAAPEARGALTLFGVDALGRVRYYAPTPVDPDPIAVASGTWRAAPLSVRLGVNHVPGPLHLYALLSPQAPTVETVDTLAATLTDAERAPPDGPWHLTANDTLLTALCGPESGACQSARLDLTLTQETP